MGQTLTHGIYLPDEGERNCYNGLAGNWQLLDSAVGTVAEHTTQIAGKAPAVHTHTKADITDLFNSANTWTGNNSYTEIVSLASSSDVAEQFKQKLPKDVSVSSDALVRFNTLVDSEDHNVIVEALGHWASYVSKSTTLKYKNDSTKQGTIDFRLSSDGYGVFYPQAPFECNLGNAGNQWKSVYAQTYYYNGTAWGLDKQNEWTNFQRMTSNPAVWYLRNNTVTLGTVPSSNRYIGMFFEDVNGADLGYASFQANKNSYNSIIFSLRNSDGTNAYTGALRYRASTTGDYCFFPETSECDLGISTNKWKTLNGINPGALGIFNPSATQDPIDVPNTWVTNGSAWNTLNVSNMGDGWICLTYRLCGANDYILARFGGTNANIYPSMIFSATRLADSGYFVYALMPVAKAMGNIYLEIKLDSNAVLVKHSFIPAYGTV